MRKLLTLLMGIVSIFQANAQLSDGKGWISFASVSPTEDEFKLSGTWEFYWDQLLEPGDKAFLTPTDWIDVPSVWESNYTALGCGTYRVRINLGKSLTNHSIYFPVINSASKIWLNGRLMEETGTVSKDLSIYAPKLSGTVATIPGDTTQLELIIQVANYTYFNGGITRAPYISKSSAMRRHLAVSNGVENFFAGSLTAMFLYQIILFVLYQRGRSYLWLALICLSVALRALVTHGGSFLLPDMFESVHWEYWKKIEFFSVYATVALFPLYIYNLFKQSSPLWPVRIFVIVALVLCSIVLVTPQYVYGRLLDVCHIGLIFAFIYAIYSVGRAWRGGYQEARIILFGVLASFPFILLEILRNTMLLSLNIRFAYLVELGVLVFLLFQIYLLASHYSKSYRRLETVNQDLEEIVASRTEELHQANSVKDRLLSVMSHDIKSPLNSLKGILQIYNMGGISIEEFGKFSQQIEDDLSSTSMLVDNILFWTAGQLKGVKVVKSKFNLQELIDENIELFNSISSRKNIRIISNLSSSFDIVFDRNILSLVIRNLLSNAIKFSHEGNEVKIQTMPTNDNIMIEVIDHGVGMNETGSNSIFRPELSVSTSGTTNEKGTGIGLSLCREYLERADSRLMVKSEVGKGTTFTVLIPIQTAD